MAAEKNAFMDNLNKEIDRKLTMIEAGQMEPVTRLKKTDYMLSAAIILASLAALIWAYFCMC